MLEKNNISVEVLDLSGIKNYLDVVKIHADSSDIKIYGLTATTPQISAAVKISKALREAGKKTILGGTHITLTNAAIKKKPKMNNRADKELGRLKGYFNKFICGDGELAVLNMMETDKDFIDADDMKSNLFLKRGSLDDYPIPARQLIDLDSYHYNIDGFKAQSLIGQLGCPFRCSYCAGRNSPFLRTARFRSYDKILDEVEFLYETYGYTGIMFYDDELNVNIGFKDLLKGLIDLQTKIGKEFRLRGFLKAELFNEEQAELMYKAGFRWLLIGFESGSDRILTNIQKMATKEDNTKAIEIAKKYGLKTKALMSLGHAGESFESIKDTKEWLLKVKPEDFDCTIISPYPGAPYYDDSELINGKYVYISPKTGDKLYMDDLDYTKDVDYYKGIPGEYVSYVWTDHISKEELVKERDNLENEVRENLNIPFNSSNLSKQYETSMGQTKLPPNILRSSDERY